MAKLEIDRARSLHGRIIDSGATRFDDYLDIDRNERADQVSLRLTAAFTERPELTALMLRIDGCDIGISTPAQVRTAAGHAGNAPDLGMAERSSLPGLSQQYRLIRFACKDSTCTAAEVHSYYDPRIIPVCSDKAHGPMELQR